MQSSSGLSVEKFKNKKGKFKDFDGEKSKPKGKKAYRLEKNKRDKIEDGEMF